MQALQQEIHDLRNRLEGLQPLIEKTSEDTQEICKRIEKEQAEADKALQVLHSFYVYSQQ